MRRKKFLMFAPLALLAFLAFVALGGVIVRALWNALLPALFGWNSVTFWQALGLLVLCRILFGGFGMRGSPRSRMHARIRDRWDHLTPEERERFRQAIGGRPAGHPPAGEGSQG